MERVLAGIRPTGKLHWGNYFGALKNWVSLQEKYDCFFFVADWHSLTSEYANSGKIKDWTLDVLKDIFASGVDPKTMGIDPVHTGQSSEGSGRSQAVIQKS